MTSSTAPPPPTRAPFISHRASLRFLPAPPTEHTNTLVLNAGGRTNLYTDFRPLIADPSACEWAFAGTKVYHAGGQCEWKHPVDSRSGSSSPGEGDEGEGEGDVGRCETLENGDELETGEMRNPATGRIEPYEEVWRDEKVSAGARVVALQLHDVTSIDSSDTERAPQVRGIFIRIGPWMQGVVALPGGRDVCARRWRFRDGGAEDAKWILAAAYGEASPMMLEPRGDSLEHSELDVPQREAGSSVVWETVEDYVWEG